jgi:hypothetical protein
MIEHCSIGGDHDRMDLRQIGGAGRQLDGFRFVDQRRQEQHRIGDVLGAVGEMLAHEGVVKTKPVAQDERLAVLPQRFAPVPMQGVHRHGEVTEPHCHLCPNCDAA